MMNALQFSKLMREAGMSEAQAEAVANGVDAYMRENSATKADVDVVRSDIKAAVAEMKQHTWQTCMTVCGAVGVIQIGVIYALLVRLAGHG